MSDLSFLEKVQFMPPDIQQEIKNYIDYVWEKKLGLGSSEKKSRISGLLKGKNIVESGF